MVRSTLFPRQNRFTSAVQMMYWLLLPQKKKLQTSNAGGWIIRSGKGQGLGENGRTSAAPPAATSRCTFSRHHRPKDLSILQRDIYLIKFKYCKDTRAQNQLSTRQEQQKDLCTTLTLRSMYYIILLGMGIAIYNTYTMEPFSKNKKDCFQASCAFCQLPLCQYRAIRGAGLLVPIIIIIKWTSCGIVLTR